MATDNSQCTVLVVDDVPVNVLLVKGGESNADKTQVGRISAAGDGHLR